VQCCGGCLGVHYADNDYMFITGNKLVGVMWRVLHGPRLCSGLMSTACTLVLLAGGICCASWCGVAAVVAQQECSRGCSSGAVCYMDYAVVKDAR